MPLPQEKSATRLTGLPNPELNPMLNPILGRNLGRWAQVYFTTPVEKREQAVLELLRELEAEAGVLPPPPVSASIHEVPKRPVAVEPGACAECGHPNVRGQRFCGMCGSPLLSEAQAEVAETETVPRERARAESAEENPREDIFQTLSFFADVPKEPVSRPSEGNGTSEAQWLRDQNHPQKPRAAFPGISLKYGFAFAGVLALGLLFYGNSRLAAKRAASGPFQIATSAQSDDEPAKAPEPRPAPPVTQPTPSAVVVASDPKADAVAPPVPHPLPPASRAASTAAPTPALHTATAPAAVPGAGSGSAELATAQSYLAGKSRPRDSAAAAKFLWRAVRKENTTAVLLLSELYLAGDGVAKNCDQARVLLMAAARKQVPEAVTRLRELETSGCP